MKLEGIISIQHIPSTHVFMFEPSLDGTWPSSDRDLEEAYLSNSNSTELETVKDNAQSSGLEYI